jgi:hypothetical protein
MDNRLFYADNHPLYNHWHRIWCEVLRPEEFRLGLPLDKITLDPRLANYPGGPPTLLAIDSACNSVTAAYVALAITHREPPRVLYHATRDKVPAPTNVEQWGINQAVRKIRNRLGKHHPIVIFTDNASVVDGIATRVSNGKDHREYRYMARDNKLMVALHDAAGALKRTLPMSKKDHARARAFTGQVRQSIVARELAKERNAPSA